MKPDGKTEDVREAVAVYTVAGVMAATIAAGLAAGGQS